ncbi:MAG: redoxin domain-containing protein [Candidatus Rokubacteria bacterium]|nr:redoxin domain-containing protein [Candidatus Rokubacteria bacterium]
MRLGYDEITRRGAEILQLTHNTAEEARRYRRHFAMAFPYLADADRAVHERYGVPFQDAVMDNVRAVVQSAIANAADVVRGERIASPLPHALRYGIKNSEQAVFVLDRDAVIRAVHTAGTNGSIPTVAQLARDLDAIG